jgi:glycosyltransferase involved in cell wall biosynthesis
LDKKISILLGAQPAIAIKKGGLYIQLLKTKEHIDKLGFNTDFYNPWIEPRKEKYDIFHLFGANFSTNIIGNLVKETGIPLILTPVYFSKHNRKNLRMINRTNKFLFRFVKFSTPHIYTNELLQIADRILPNTHMEKHLITDGFGIQEDKVTVIHNGVDERFSKATPDLFIEKFGEKDFLLYVGYIGNERKNTLQFIKALEGVDIKTFLIGSVVKTAYCKRCLEEIRKNKRITILEPLPHNSKLLESAYAACDTFILPSIFETPGLAALEAGLAGAKIVITLYGGTKEYFREEATYIQPNSVSSIRKGIEKSLDKKKTPVLKKYIKEHFLWGKIAEKLAEIYREFGEIRRNLRD